MYRLLLTKKYIWGSEQQESFDKLKEILISPGVLTIPTKTGKFMLDCDASDYAIGAELLQEQEGELRVIAYGSYALNPQQRKYCTTRKELLAIVRFTNAFRHYLLGQRFVVRTDHHGLKWLKTFRHIEGQLARWVEELEQFDMEILHRKGKDHQNADALSRIPEEVGCFNYEANKELESLPCGGCKYCRKFQEKWKSFETQVDDVVPLSSGGVISSIDLDEATGWTLEELREEQKKDPEINLLYEGLVNNIDPTQEQVSLASTGQKYYWLNKELFEVTDQNRQCSLQKANQQL